MFISVPIYSTEVQCGDVIKGRQDARFTPSVGDLKQGRRCATYYHPRQGRDDPRKMGDAQGELNLVKEVLLQRFTPLYCSSRAKGEDRLYTL